MTREEAILCLKGMKNYARDTFTEQADWQDSLNMAIEALEAEPRWIPCSERLPEYITSVLVQLTRTGDIFIGALVGTYTMWDLPNFSSYICLEDVIAWMPLPEPYKMDEVEE